MVETAPTWTVARTGAMNRTSTDWLVAARFIAPVRRNDLSSPSAPSLRWGTDQERRKADRGVIFATGDRTDGA